MNRRPQSSWASASSNPWSSISSTSNNSGNLTPPAPASRGEWPPASSASFGSGGSNPFAQQQQSSPGFGSNPWNSTPTSVPTSVPASFGGTFGSSSSAPTSVSASFGSSNNGGAFGQSQKSVWGAQSATSSMISPASSMPSVGFGNIGGGSVGFGGGFGSTPTPTPPPPKPQSQPQGFGGGGFASLQPQPQSQLQVQGFGGGGNYSFGAAPTGPSPALFAPSQPQPSLAFGAPPGFGAQQPQQPSPGFGGVAPGFGCTNPSASDGEVQHLKIQAAKHERQMAEANERIQLLQQENRRLQEQVQQLRGTIAQNDCSARNGHEYQVVEQRVDNPDYFLDADTPLRPKHPSGFRV